MPAARRAATRRTTRCDAVAWGSPIHVPPFMVSVACPGASRPAPTAQAAPITRDGPKAVASRASLATPFCRERTPSASHPGERREDRGGVLGFGRDQQVVDGTGVAPAGDHPHRGGGVDQAADPEAPAEGCDARRAGEHGHVRPGGGEEGGVARPQRAGPGDEHPHPGHRARIPRPSARRRRPTAGRRDARPSAGGGRSGRIGRDGGGTLVAGPGLSQAVAGADDLPLRLGPDRERPAPWRRCSSSAPARPRWGCSRRRRSLPLAGAGALRRGLGRPPPAPPGADLGRPGAGPAAGLTVPGGGPLRAAEPGPAVRRRRRDRGPDRLLRRRLPGLRPRSGGAPAGAGGQQQARRRARPWRR